MSEDINGFYSCFFCVEFVEKNYYFDIITVVVSHQMSSFLSSVDPDGLMEYSVVFTDRSLNHMSQKFQGVMRELSDTLKSVYNGDAFVLVPGNFCSLV